MLLTHLKGHSAQLALRKMIHQAPQVRSTEGIDNPLSLSCLKTVLIKFWEGAFGRDGSH